uniref:ParB/Sulfiredoxin domain-containing protein n=1 Tax=viral metagenome TaxID=1070528 RepID=A0A6C0JMM6_9ZZZZ
MDYIKDSVETSVNLKIFKNIEKASTAHIFKSELIKLPLSLFKNVKNFDPIRLQESAIKAYPITNRPRGKNDIQSVKFYQKLLQQKIIIHPIWLVQQNEIYTLMDGAHRIVASFIEKEKHIYAYVIKI